MAPNYGLRRLGLRQGGTGDPFIVAVPGDRACYWRLVPLGSAENLKDAPQSVVVVARRVEHNTYCWAVT